MTEVLVWPDGSTYAIVASSAATGGERLVMEWDLPARAWAPQTHVHPALSEDYEVLDGELGVIVAGRERTLGPGDRATVPPGAPHTFRVGDVPVRLRNVHRPALDFEPYITRLCAAAREHALGDLTGLRALLVVAALVHEFPQHSRAPGRLLNAAIPLLARLGRAVPPR